jgi:hypothetical protein
MRRAVTGKTHTRMERTAAPIACTSRLARRPRVSESSRTGRRCRGPRPPCLQLCGSDHSDAVSEVTRDWRGRVLETNIVRHCDRHCEIQCEQLCDYLRKYVRGSVELGAPSVSSTPPASGRTTATTCTPAPSHNSTR